jgi:hypothetical protein
MMRPTPRATSSIKRREGRSAAAALSGKLPDTRTLFRMSLLDGVGDLGELLILVHFDALDTIAL